MQRNKILVCLCKNIKCPQKMVIVNYIDIKCEELKRSIYSEFIAECTTRDENELIQRENYIVVLNVGGVIISIRGFLVEKMLIK